MTLKRLSLGLPLVALAACHVVFPYSSADSAGAREGSVLDGPRRSEMKARDATVPDWPQAVTSEAGTCRGGMWCPWNTATGTVLHDVWGTSASDVYVAGEGINAVPVILHSIPGDWAPVVLGSSSFPRTVGAVNALFVRVSATTYLLAGADDAIYSGDPNAPLTGSQDPTRTIYTGAWATPDTDVVVGYRGPNRVARYRQGGKPWQELGINLMSSAANKPLMAVTGVGDIVFAAGDQGLVLQCEKASGSCTELTWSSASTVNPKVAKFKGVWASATLLVIVGENTTTTPSTGYVVFYDRSNNTATDYQLPAVVNDVWGSSDTSIFVVGADDLIVRFDSPVTSVLENTASSGTLNGVWGNGFGFVVAVGSGGRTLVRGP
jgi:hypothetical protein